MFFIYISHNLVILILNSVVCVGTKILKWVVLSMRLIFYLIFNPLKTQMVFIDFDWFWRKINWHSRNSLRMSHNWIACNLIFQSYWIFIAVAFLPFDFGWNKKNRFELRCQSKTNFNQLVSSDCSTNEGGYGIRAIWPSIRLCPQSSGHNLESWAYTYTPFSVRLLNELNIWNHMLTIYIYSKRSDFVASFIKKILRSLIRFNEQKERKNERDEMGKNKQQHVRYVYGISQC